MEYQPNARSITSESAPLIEPVDNRSDQELFMVPLKRPSPRLAPSRYRNVKPRSPPRSPAHISKRSSPKLFQDFQTAAMAYQSPPLTGNATMKPSGTPNPMFAMSPLTSSEGVSSARPIYRPSTNFNNSNSMIYNSPPMSDRNMMPNGLESRAIMSPEMMQLDPSPHNSPNPESSDEQPTTSNNSSPRLALSTKASSVYSPPATSKIDIPSQPPVPEIPPLSTLRNLKSHHHRPAPLPLLSPSHLAPPIDTNWTVPDSPLERLSQLRATRDSAYDRAREMEIRRSEWKHVVYRFPVKGAEHRIVDCDLTESSHARLADVARRSSEGFEWNGEVEYAEIYRVLCEAHLVLMGEMRIERVQGGGNGMGGGIIGSREVLERLRAGGVKV
ncbi:hypothetical protein QBC44DRAFT_302226 [Cladorrhinum sp. PSN332]|nr:hypothetical protein QBC44DRAFT_302226 [Cladorrhinum sp. PSN332]